MMASSATLSHTPGTRVFQRHFGRGTVTACHATGDVDVVFLDGQTRRVSTDPVWLVPLTPAQDEALARLDRRNCEATFQRDDKSHAHGHGGHWGIFVEDPLVFMQGILPKAIPHWGTLPCYGASRVPPFALPPDSAPGWVRCWPIPRQGAIFVVKGVPAQGNRNEVVSFYPWVSEGVQHRLRIERVDVWEDDLEGQITGSIADTFGVSFFDAQLAAHRGFYSANREYEFVLAGLAYSCRNPATQEFVFPLSPEAQRAYRRAGVAIVDDKMALGMAGSTCLIPSPSRDRDDCLYRGPVTRVEQTELIGRPTAKLWVTVARDPDTQQSLELAVYVPDRSLEGPVPKVGDEVEGSLWLQGYLWAPIPFDDFPWAVAAEAGVLA